MNDFNDIVLNYFLPSKDYFWRWADNGEVIEWADGRTLCYRADLIYVLNGLAPHGLLPVGTILLTLAACKDDFDGFESNKSVETLLESVKKKDENHPQHLERAQVINYIYLQARNFLKLVRGLPLELRTGPKRIHLLFEIMEQTDEIMPPETAFSMLSVFESGKLDRLIFEGGEKFQREILAAELRKLEWANRKFNAESLALKLRTGLFDLPETADLTLAEAPSGNLFQDLLQDQRTEGLALLSKQLIAALHIPMHTQGSSDQAYGGVSDISNRGDFDRLLLSELAHDDLSLIARLVNNEALYLQRESPPEHLPQERRILVDTSLRMWGTQRVFAIAAALAAAQKTQKDTHIEAFALEKDFFSAFDIATKEGIVDALELLSPQLDSYEAVWSFFEKNPLKGEDENILITHQKWLTADPMIVEHIIASGELNYLIAVGGEGELELFQFMNGRRKRLSDAKIDLAKSLFVPKRKAPKIRLVGDLPKFYEEDVPPLYFPTKDMQISENNFYGLENRGSIGVTTTHRLLYWKDKHNGALEVLEFIENGNYHFADDGKNQIYILIVRPKTQRLICYTFHLISQWVKKWEVDCEGRMPLQVFFSDQVFYVPRDKNFYYKLSPDKEAAKRIEGRIHLKDKQTTKDWIGIRGSSRYWKRQINPGYSVLNEVGRIGIGKFEGKGQAKLFLGGRVLDSHNNHLKLRETFYPASKFMLYSGEAQLIDHFVNKAVSLKCFEWEDGSRAYLDSRGFMHLVSADSSLPEVSFVMVLEKITACWASDGSTSGSSYFINVTPEKFLNGIHLNAGRFNQKYLEPFIQHILDHAPEA